MNNRARTRRLHFVGGEITPGQGLILQYVDRADRSKRCTRDKLALLCCCVCCSVPLTASNVVFLDRV